MHRKCAYVAEVHKFQASVFPRVESETKILLDTSDAHQWNIYACKKDKSAWFFHQQIQRLVQPIIPETERHRMLSNPAAWYKFDRFGDESYILCSSTKHTCMYMYNIGVVFMMMMMMKTILRMINYNGTTTTAIMCSGTSAKTWLVERDVSGWNFCVLKGTWNCYLLLGKASEIFITFPTS